MIVLVIAFPHTESLYSLSAEQSHHCLVALLYRQGNLLVYKVVVEAYLGSVLAVVGIVDVVEMSPVNGSKTHWARLARGVDVASAEVEGAKAACCLAYAVYLGMCCWVVVDGYAVGCFGYNLVAFGYHGAEGTASVAHTLFRETNGAAHQFDLFILHNLI